MLPKLLIPHLCAAALFLGAHAWARAVGTNRSMADLYLATAGFGFAIGAVVATLLAAALVIARREHRAGWPWLLVHAALLALVLAQGSASIATHLA